MKPMPYTPYVKCDCGDKWLGVHYARPENHEWDYYSLKDLPDVSLTDAECAAEFWRAEIDQNGDWEKTYPFHDEDHPLWERYLTSSKQAETWYRFATTPHAFRSLL